MKAVDGAKAGGARFVARLSPGQVAVYEVYETDSTKKDEVKRSRVRVEVLRVTAEGVVLRATDFWEGKDKSVRPRVMGESAERTKEITFDALVPVDGSEAVAADRDAARDEMIAAGVAQQRALGVEEARLKAAAEAMRSMVAAPEVIDSGVRRHFAMLFNGLGAPVVASAGEPVEEVVQVGAMTLKGTRRTATVVDEKGRAVRTETRVTPAAEHRRVLREVTASIAKEQGVDLAEVERAMAPRLAAMRDSEVKMVITSDPASGWPVEVKWTSEKQSKGEDVRQSRTLTLVEGPDPVIAPPPADAGDEGSDAYVRWLTGMVYADAKPVRLFGRMGLDRMEKPTASQRKMLLDEAAAGKAGVEKEEPPAVTLAGAGSVGLAAADLDAVSAAYGKMSPGARRAVMMNALGVKEEWGGSFVARLLSQSPTEKELDGLPLRVVEGDRALANRALRVGLAGSKAGSFDWDLLYSGYALGKNGALDAELKAALYARAAAVLGQQVELAKPKQKGAHGNWVYEDDYGPVNALMALAADVLGGAKGDVGLAELRECAKLTDERASAFAVAVLTNRGEKVDAATVERLCRGATGWYTLVSQLDEGKKTVVPEAARTLELAARADMVRWLVYPTELGQEPEAVELVKTVDGEGSGGKERYYIFKFRSDLKAFKDDGWMMGLSGPWDPSKPFTQPAGGHTFSEFESIGKSTAEEQAAGIIKKLQEAWKEEAERAKAKGEGKK